MSATTIKERPVLFKPEMIQAILENLKIETRRPVKSTEFQKSETPGFDWTFRDRRGCWNDVCNEEVLNPPNKQFAKLIRPPLGYVGDRMWLRESWRPSFDDELHDVVEYRVDGAKRKPQIKDKDVGMRFNEACEFSESTDPWRSPMFMPRWASRTTLAVERLRIEHVQEITDEGAFNEGIRQFTKDHDVFKYWPCDPADGRLKCAWADLPRSPRDAFAAGWDSLYGGTPFAWAENPPVWVYRFRKLAGEAP